MRDTNSLYADQTDIHSHARSVRMIEVMLLISLIVITITAFFPALSNDFVNWDDLQNLIENESYRGFSSTHLEWMFTTTHGGHYQPLSWMTFAFDHQLWGLDPFGFHLTNLLLHILTGILFLSVAYQIYRKLFINHNKRLLLAGGLWASLLFAIHPLRVESVAWATERRDVLSGMWLMATLLCYLKAYAGRTNQRYWCWMGVSLVTYLLSLLSKAAGITLPIVLLILDYYISRKNISRSDVFRKFSLRKLLLEKAAFTFPAGVIAMVALHAQSRSGALWGFDVHPLGLRIAQAFYGIMFYPIKTLWPTSLIPLYEQQPDASALEMIYVVSAFCVIGLTILFWKLRRRYPSLLTCWGLYIVILSPMLGIAQSGPQVVADRYSYLSCMPWAVLCGGMLIKLVTRYKKKTAVIRFVTIASIMIVVVLVFFTRSQTKIWRNSYTLWTTTLERAPDTPTAHTNLAVVLNQRQEYQRAIKHSIEALKTLPNNRTAHITLARALAATEDFRTADEHYDTALNITHTLGKTDPNVLTQAIYVKARLGEDDEAWRLFQQIQEHEHPHITNKIIRAAESMAAGMAERGDFDQAVTLLKETIRFNPDVISESVQSRIETQISQYKEGKTLRE